MRGLTACQCLLTMSAFLWLAAPNRAIKLTGTSWRNARELSPMYKHDIFSRDTNGGTTCAACAVVVGLVEQLAEIYNISVADSIAKFCSFFPAGFHEACKLLVEDYAPSLIDLLEKRETPDIVCHAINLCKNDTGHICHLFPLPKSSSQGGIQKRIMLAKMAAQTAKLKSKSTVNLSEELFVHPFLTFQNLCNISVIKPICEIIDSFGNKHLPVDDVDSDYFSDIPTFRGSSWRGRDCNDFDATMYPGRYSEDDAVEDRNCNGIAGIDSETGKTYESLWCKDTKQMGTIVLGDSAAAHFHLPPGWFTSKNLSVEVFKDVFFILENEIDWPMLSSATGYMNSTWPHSISGPVNSTYLNLRAINRCNHRDFQNIAVNGARSGSMADNIVKGFARHGSKDNPVFLTLALIGNDVCSGHQDTTHMTTPEEFYTNNLKTLRYVDLIVAPGSIVVAMGVVDGRVLYNFLHDHIHPIGSLRNDVTYSQFYDYLNCLKVSPCFGWMNSNETWRNITTERAFQLNDAFQNLVAKETFQNFKAVYMDPPIQKIFKIWGDAGGDPTDLLEPVDGFHPSQLGNALTTKVMFDELEKMGLLPPTNPFNEKIAEKFGDQGGY